jgi:hypothetical protein
VLEQYDIPANLPTVPPEQPHTAQLPVPALVLPLFAFVDPLHEVGEVCPLATHTTALALDIAIINAIIDIINFILFFFLL